MIKFFKKLRWLIKNQENLQKILEAKNKPKEKVQKTYSLAGVPEFQLGYVNDILEKDENN